MKTGRGCGQPGRGTDSRPSTACFPTTARNPDADSGSAVSSRFLCNEIVRQEGLGALSNDELYKLLNYRESRLKLSECLERAEKQSGVKDIPGKQNALAPEENKMEGPVQSKGTDVRQSSALINRPVLSVHPDKQAMSFPDERARKDRLEKKEGYLERKQAAEANRLEQEKKVLDLIGNTSERCRDSLTALDKTRVGKSGSESYEQLHKVLEVGAKLGSQTSVRDMTEFLRLFNEASESYSRGHNTLLGPLTGDGIKRLEESQTLNEFGKQASETLKTLSKDLGDKHTPIGLRIKNRSEDLAYLKNKQAERNGPEKKPEIKAAVQGAPFVLS